MNNVINEFVNASDDDYVTISDDYAALESVISALFAFLDDRQYDTSADDQKTLESATLVPTSDSEL